MSFKLLSKSWKVKVGDPQAKLVLLKLADHADEKGECWPTIIQICEATELSERTVHRKLKELEDGGFISRERGVNQVFYTVNPCHSDTPSNTSTPVTLTPCHADTPVTVTPPPPVTVAVTKKSTYQYKNTYSAKARGSVEEFRDYAVSLGLTKGDGDFLFDHFEEGGWMRGKVPIKCWRAAMRKWRQGGWLPSQKAAAAAKQKTTINDLLANQ